MSSVRSQRVAVAAGIVVAAFCVAGLVGAFWSAGSGPGGNGHALAGTPTDRRGAERLSRITDRLRDLGAVECHRLAARAARRGRIRRHALCGGRAHVSDRSRRLMRRNAQRAGRPHELHRVLARDRSLALHGDADAVQLDRWREHHDRDPHRGARPASSRSRSRTEPAPATRSSTTTNRSSLDFSVTLPTTSLASDTIDLVLSDGVTTVAASAAGIDGWRSPHVHGHRRLEPRRRADHDLGVGHQQLRRRVGAGVDRAYEGHGGTDPRLALDARQQLQRQGRPRARHLLRVARGLLGAAPRRGRSRTSPREERSPPSRSRPRSPRSRSPKARELPTPPSGSFTVALATNATGIRDAAGNLSSLCGDGACGRRQAGPRRGHARHAGRHCERQGRSRAGDLLGDARRLHRHRSLDAHERPLVGNALVGLHLGSDRHARHRRGRRRPEHRRRHLPCRPRRERDRHPRRCRQPVLDRLDRSRRPSHADPRRAW